MLYTSICYNQTYFYICFNQTKPNHNHHRHHKYCSPRIPPHSPVPLDTAKPCMWLAAVWPTPNSHLLFPSLPFSLSRSPTDPSLPLPSHPPPTTFCHSLTLCWWANYLSAALDFIGVGSLSTGRPHGLMLSPRGSVTKLWGEPLKSQGWLEL